MKLFCSHLWNLALYQVFPIVQHGKIYIAATDFWHQALGHSTGQMSKIFMPTVISYPYDPHTFGISKKKTSVPLYPYPLLPTSLLLTPVLNSLPLCSRAQTDLFFVVENLPL